VAVLMEGPVREDAKVLRVHGGVEDLAHNLLGRLAVVHVSGQTVSAKNDNALEGDE